MKVRYEPTTTTVPDTTKITAETSRWGVSVENLNDKVVFIYEALTERAIKGRRVPVPALLAIVMLFLTHYGIAFANGR